MKLYTIELAMLTECDQTVKVVDGESPDTAILKINEENTLECRLYLSKDEIIALIEMLSKIHETLEVRNV